MSFIREPDAEPIPGYHLIGPLGSGGFGEVWKCEAPGGIYKAIKFVYGNLNSLDVDRAPAEQEFNALNAVKEVRHPFVLSMDRIEVVEGELCIVMELADKNMQDAFEECQGAGMVGIPRDDLLRYLRDAAEALDHMIQKHNLQHLDIKPRNLFLISDRVKVADFGLVKHLEKQSGSLSSVTPIYAPPETFAGKISEHSDQYSLAIVYQEMLTGQRPFPGKNARQLMMQHTSQDPELRSLPEPERPVIARALAKDPAKRFPNCLSFIRALYNARPKVEALVGDGKGNSKSMSETMEDISLEAMEGEVDLGGTPTQSDEEGPVSELGLTLIQPQTGALRPTLIIGMGGFAKRCLLEMRCRFVDRFGDLKKIPLLRFLYVDPDLDSCQSLMKGSDELICTSDEVYHMGLQPISNYRRRMMDQLVDWMPHEKLYTLPRSLQTQGVRALGRLAFVDNHLRLLGKVRRAVQHISHPDSLYQAVSQTGLALRDRKPRVYVIMAAGGGSSGSLVDLGYGLRRLLTQLKMANAEVTAVVFCGAPDDPATPKAEQANVYATLTELSHFCDPNVPFTAQYGDGPRLVDEGPPFNYVYLLKLAHRSPEAMRDAVAHLGSYLYHELATPLGIKLEGARKPRPSRTDSTPFRSFGTYAVWFPRGLMLRLAARQACLNLLKDWQQKESPTATAEIEAACARALADPELRYETVCAHVEELAAAGFDGNLASALTSFLASLEEQSMQAIAQDDPGNWARQVALRVQEWVGTSIGLNRDSDLQKSKLNRALMGAINKLADKWNHKLTKVAYGLMEVPGHRIANSEAAIERLSQFCIDQSDAYRDRLQQQVQRSRQAEQQLEKALDSCLTGGGGFSFFGNRNRRLLRVFMDHLAAYSRQCLAESLVGAGLQFYTALQSRLDDRMRELSFCRQRIRHMQEKLEASREASQVDPVKAMEDPSDQDQSSTESYWELIRASETARLVLPDGETELERAALKFLRTVKSEEWVALDQSLQDQVFAALGGLHKVCLTSNDLHRSLTAPVLMQLAASLGDLLPITDVAQVEFSSVEAGKGDVTKNIDRYYRRAAPLLDDKDPSNENVYLLLPASEAGKAFGDNAKSVVPQCELVKVPGQADLMFCREQGYLNSETLRQAIRPCKQAFEEAAYAPASSPFSRFDITDWIPLE